MKTQATFPLAYNYREKFRDIKRNASANLLLSFYLTEWNTVETANKLAEETSGHWKSSF